MVRTIAGALAALGFLLGPCALAADAEPRRITVTGSAEAEAVPDMATLAIGVETEAETPGKALADNAARMTTVMDRLKAAGIEGRDLQTSQLGIWPVFAEQQQAQVIVGYHASNQLAVTIRAIDRLGAILDQAVADGANSISGPTFGIADPEPLLAAARDAAIRDAIAKARRYAAAADVELGKVLAIDESVGSPVPYPRMRAEAMAAATPIAPGETTISASVAMTFAIE
jgi:hypothetical protein